MIIRTSVLSQKGLDVSLCWTPPPNQDMGLRVNRSRIGNSGSSEKFESQFSLSFIKTESSGIYFWRGKSRLLE